jgi:hypothetical protein
MTARATTSTALYMTTPGLEGLNASRVIGGPSEKFNADWLNQSWIPCILPQGQNHHRSALAFEELMAHAKAGRIGADLNDALRRLFVGASNDLRPDVGGEECFEPEHLAWMEKLLQQTGEVLIEIGGEDNIPKPDDKIDRPRNT